MERITKKVLREEEFYVAFNGKEFDNEEECRNYENKLNINFIETYDENFNRIDFDSATYVVIHSEADLYLVREVCDYNSWTSNGLCEVGLFRYDNSFMRNRWEKVKIPNFLKDFIEFI